MNYCNVRKNIVENKRKYNKDIDIHIYFVDMIPKALETNAQTHTMTMQASGINYFKRYLYYKGNNYK